MGISRETRFNKTFPIKPSVLRRLKLKRFELEDQGAKPRNLASNRMIEYLVESKEFDKIIEKAIEMVG